VVGMSEATFYDNVTPALAAGDYQVIVQDTVTVAGDSGTPASYATVQRFRVAGSRTGLGPGDVVAMSPPSGESGSYGLWLPHVVLAQRTLPWQVPIADTASSQGGPAQPWLALLLLTRQEIDVAGSPPAAGTTGTQTVPLSACLTPPSGTLGPVATTGQSTLLQEQPSLTCTVVDITAAAFSGVVPEAAELAFLAHARQVSTAGQEDLGVPAPGWYSVVAGNRLPTGASDNVYIAHLVSLEGFASYLPGNAVPAGNTLVRLISLASWTFTSTTGTGDFGYLMGQLNIAPLTVPVTVTGTDTASQLVAGAVADGYTLLSYTTRLGEQTAAWYRGPLLPKPVTANPQPAYPAAAAALIYDPATGMFDASYAAAWEIGRLLTLANGPVASSLASWVAAAASAVRLLAGRVGTSVGPDGAITGQPAAADALAAGAWQRAARRLIGERVAPAVLRLGAGRRASGLSGPSRPSGPPPGAAADPAGPRGGEPAAQQVPRHEALRQLAMAPAAQPTIATQAGAPPDDVSAWLTNLQQLIGVPFGYLVPDARMLPPESIRFFAVDPNWTAALTDGVLSLAAKTAPAAAATATLRPAALAAAATTTGYSGFLLRSAAVSSWPGMTVAGYADSQTATPLTLVRIERLAPTVLIGLFAGLVQHVELTEPRQQLHFGVSQVTDGFALPLRWIDAANAGGPTGDPPAPVTLRPDSARSVIDIGATETSVSQNLTSAYEAAQQQVPQLTPAGFSLQFLQDTESQAFTVQVTA
jgi:hypothetical protein